MAHIATQHEDKLFQMWYVVFPKRVIITTGYLVMLMSIFVVLKAKKMLKEEWCFLPKWLR